jgi:outer membrane protein assembly factor BamB
VFISPAVAGDRLIIASCAGSVYALDRSTGKPAWTYDTAEDGPRAQFHGEAILAGGTLVLPSDAAPSSNLYAFDAATGEVRWRMDLEGGVPATPVLVGHSVIATSAAGKVVRIDLESGKAAWTAVPAGERPAVPRIAAPAADAKRVYFASNDARLFALDAASGAVVWKKDLAARINSSLVLHAGALWGGAADGHLYAFDPASGEIRQRIAVGGLPYGTLVVAPPLLVALVNGKPARLVAVDLATNKVRWERSTEREWTTMKPLVRDDAVIAGTEEKELCAFALADGAIRWCTNVPQIPRGLGTAGGMLYVGTLNGKVLAYRLQ